MAKKSAKAPASKSNEDIPVVGPREPCPCGSGRRYKACHGKEAARSETKLVQRPFEGLSAECDLIAMATLVPAATAELTLKSGGTITAATVLPMAWPALHRADGQVLVGMQITGGSGDPSRDIAAALEKAQDMPAGTPVLEVGRPGVGERLQDVVDGAAPFTVEMHEGFDFWLEGADPENVDAVKESLERANEAVVPTARLESVEAAYWCRIGTKEHLRWVMPQDEEALLDAFAKLQDDDKLGLGPGTRYIGSFRSHGLLVAVWDLAPGDEAADIEEPAAEFQKRLDAALKDSSELTSEQRRLRAGLTGRQLTLR